MEHHHISTKSFADARCIDIYLDHENSKVHIIDALDAANKVVISGSDWNELVDRIKSSRIGKVTG